MSLEEKGAQALELRPIGIPDSAEYEEVLTRVATENDRDSHFLRHYDMGVSKWVRDVVAVGSKSIRTIRSTPMRAFADYKCLLEKEDPNFANKMQDASSIVRFPMPLAVIGKPSWAWRSEWGNAQIYVEKIGLSEDNLRTGYSRPPRPIDLTYQIDFYTRMDLHARWIVEQIERQFRPMAYATIPSPYQGSDEDAQDLVRYMPIKYGEFVDNSELEPDDGQDRLFRHTLSITVEGFKFHDILEAPVVHRMITEIHEGEEDNLIEEAITDETEYAPVLTSDEIDEIDTTPSTDGL